MTSDDTAPNWVWAWRGIAHLASVHSLVLMGAQVGFAALCRDFGVTLGEAVVLTLFVWALPSQVTYIGLAAAGVSFIPIALAVSLSALRFLPMAMTLTPMVRAPGTSKLALYGVVSFVTITSWVFAVAHVPSVPRERRVAFFGAFSLGLAVVNAVIVVIAYVAVATVPPVISMLLTFLIPVYFLLALTAAVKEVTDGLALMAGMLGLPLAAMFAGELDVLVAGVLGGTLAYVAGRVWRQRKGRT